MERNTARDFDGFKKRVYCISTRFLPSAPAISRDAEPILKLTIYRNKYEV